MIFKVSNCTTEVTGDFPYAKLVELLRLTEKSYVGNQAWFKAAVRHGKKMSPYKEDEYCFLDVQNRFPTGLLGFLTDSLRKLGYVCEIKDCRTAAAPAPISGDWTRFGERDYQEQILAALDRKKRGLIELATGGGKTYLYSRIIEKLATTALVLVPSKMLLDQTHEELSSSFGRICGRLGDGAWEPNVITVALPQTILKAMQPDSPRHTELQGLRGFFGALLVDEVHHVTLSPLVSKRVEGSKRWKKERTLMWFNVCQFFDAYYRYGLSGTLPPFGSNDRLMAEAVTGRLINSTGLRELMDKGWLRRPDVIIHQFGVVDQTGYRAAMEEADEDEKDEIEKPDWLMQRLMNLELNAERNDLIAGIVREEASAGHSVMVAVDRVDTQGRELYSRLSDIAGFIHGKTKGNTEAVHALNSREVPALIGTVFREGTDLPDLDVVVRAFGGLKDINIKQLLGRAVRAGAGKRACRVHDILDMDGGVLERHAKARIRTYRQLGLEVRIVSGVSA